MPNVIDFKNGRTLPDQPGDEAMTEEQKADALLKEMQGKLGKALVIGYAADRDSLLFGVSGSATVAQILLMLERTKLALMTMDRDGEL